MGKKLLVLGAGLLQIPTIRCAKKMGLDVLVADMNPDAIGFKESGIKKFVVSTTDTAGILDVARRENIDGILTASRKCALQCTNKAEMREALEIAGVPIPKFAVVRSAEDAINVGKYFEGKVVVKASDNSGNRGISMVDDCRNSYELQNAFNYALDNSHDKRVLIEEYMNGEEFSVEGISINGVYHAIIKIAGDAAKALGIANGPSHAEIKLTSEGPKIVEVGARLGGGCITSHLVPLSTGVSMVKAAIQNSIGESPDIEHKFSKGAAIRFFDSHKGTITAFENVESALSMPGVIEISFFKNVGEDIGELKTGLDRVGYVIAQGEDREDAVKKCVAALKRVEIKLT